MWAFCIGLFDTISIFLNRIEVNGQLLYICQVNYPESWLSRHFLKGIGELPWNKVMNSPELQGLAEYSDNQRDNWSWIIHFTYCRNHSSEDSDNQHMSGMKIVQCMSGSTSSQVDRMSEKASNPKIIKWTSTASRTCHNSNFHNL